MDNWRKLEKRGQIGKILWECVDLRIMTSYWRFFSDNNRNMISFLELMLFLAPLRSSGISSCPAFIFDPIDLTMFSLKWWIKYQNTVSVLWIFPFCSTSPLLSCFHLFLLSHLNCPCLPFSHKSLFQPHLGYSHCLGSPLTGVRNSLTYASLFFVSIF